MTPPKYILWDHDGVLVDTEPVFFEATARALALWGVEVTHPEWAHLQANGQGIVRLIHEGGLADSEGQIRIDRDRIYGDLLAKREVLIPGARAVLERVSRRYPSVMVTTSLRRFVDQMHGGSGLLDHFERVLTAEDCTRHKPHPEPYLSAMELLGARPDECVAIEDSPRGLTSALAAGVRCVVVRSGFMVKADFGGASAVLDSLAEFEPFLDGLGGEG